MASIYRTAWNAGVGFATRLVFRNCFLNSVSVIVRCVRLVFGIHLCPLANTDQRARTNAGIWMIRAAGGILGLPEETVDEQLARIRRQDKD